MSVEHAHPESEITVCADTQGTSIEIKVENVGDPIPDYAIDKLFDRFYALPNRKGHKGSGIGLSFVREITKLHEGSVKLENIAPNAIRASIKF